MARKLAIELVGSAASLKAALGSASASVMKFAGDYDKAFSSMSTSTLKLAVAQDKLAISTARYGVGTTGAAAATVKYRNEIESLATAQTAAMSRIGRSITTGITLPTVILGYEAVKMGVEFNKNMLMIQTQAGASAQEVKNLTGQVLDLARVSPQGPVELAQGLYHLESLGLRGSKAMGALRLSAIAAGMGIANIEDVTTALGGAIVTGVQGTQNFGQAMGTLVATIGVGNMRMQELTGALGTGLLPAAKNAGLNLSEVGAALAVLTDRGISAENAGTRLRMTFALMQSPSDKAKKALADLGIDADDMATKLHGPNGLLTVLVMLHDAMARVGSVRGGSDILRAFGGGRSGAGILTLIQSLDSSVSSYQGKLAAIEAQQGDFAKNMQAYMASPAYKLSVALNNLKVDLTNLGYALTPAAVGLGKAISTIANAFDKLPGPIKEDMGIIIGVLAVGGPLMIALAGIRKMVTAVGLTFKTLPIAAGTAAAETEASLAGVTTAAATTGVEMSALQQRIAAYGIGAPAAAAEVESSMVGVQASVASTAGALGMLRGGLLALGRMAPILITIEIVTQLVPGSKKGQKALDAAGVGFLGHLPLGLGKAAQYGALGGNEIRKLRGKKPYDTGAYGMNDQEKQQLIKSQTAILNMSFKEWSKMTHDKNADDFKMARENAIQLLSQYKDNFDPSKYEHTNLHLPRIPHTGPKTKLPRSITNEQYWAQTTAGMKDDLKGAEDELSFWQEQIKKAQKGTDAYNMILQQLAQASQNVRSIQSQIATANKKAQRATFKMPPSIAGAISKAIAGHDPDKELAALNRAIGYLKRRIAGEKNAADKAAEESKLASYVQQVASVKKAIGKKLIDSLQAKLNLDQTTPSLMDDIADMKKLRAALEQQIKIQRGNNDLQTQLASVNQQFAQMRENLIQSFRQTMGTLGQGPVIDPENDPMRKWMLGVRHSAQQYLADLKAQIKEFSQLQGLIRNLQKKGAPNALIDELRGQGMAAFPELFALAHADKGTLKKFFAAYQQREQMLRVTANAVITANTVQLIVKGGGLRDSGDAQAASTRGARGRVGKPNITSKPTGEHTGPNRSDARRAMSTVGTGTVGTVTGSSPARQGDTHVHLEVDGREVAEVVLPGIQKKSRSNATQRRGRYGGTSTGIG